MDREEKNYKRFKDLEEKYDKLKDENGQLRALLLGQKANIFFNKEISKA